MSAISAFNTQLINFFRDLSETFPEEKDLKMAIEALEGTKKINPRLIVDLFREHVYKGFAEFIRKEDVNSIILLAKHKFSTQFNEIMPALSIFDKHWATLDDRNRASIFKYLKVLIILCEKCESPRAAADKSMNLK